MAESGVRTRRSLRSNSSRATENQEVAQNIRFVRPSPPTITNKVQFRDRVSFSRRTSPLPKNARAKGMSSSTRTALATKTNNLPALPPRNSPNLCTNSDGKENQILSVCGSESKFSPSYLAQQRRAILETPARHKNARHKAKASIQHLVNSKNESDEDFIKEEHETKLKKLLETPAAHKSVRQKTMECIQNMVSTSKKSDKSDKESMNSPMDSGHIVLTSRKSDKSDKENKNLPLESGDNLLSDNDPENDFDIVNDDLGIENEDSAYLEKRDELGSVASENHPRYGKLLHDFGFKKLYLASGRQLCDTVPIWHLQRPPNHDRVAIIAKCKMEEPSFPGVITIFDFERESPSLEIPQVCGVIDGQHRILAIYEILKTCPQKHISIAVEVFPVQTQNQVNELFQEINKSEQVQEIDLPYRIRPENKAIIDDACGEMKKMFPEIIGNNNRCRAPNLCVDTLRQILFEAEVLKICNLKTPEEVVELLLKCNEHFSHRTLKDWPKNVQRNWKKANRLNFYLGMMAGSEWLEIFIELGCEKDNETIIEE